MNCNDIILAPMAGITDYPFRKTVRLFGNHLLFTEMIPVEGLKYNKKIILQMKEIQQEKNVAIQLLGHEIDSMIFAAKLAEQAGAQRIDINMGCPVKKILQSHAGCYLMRDVDYAAKLAQAIVQSVQIPVTVKTRLGLDENHINVVELAQKLEEAGISTSVNLNKVNKFADHAQIGSWALNGVYFMSDIGINQELVIIFVFPLEQMRKWTS